MTDALTRLRASGLISVCLINGSCIGGGAELATVCDYRLSFVVPVMKWNLKLYFVNTSGSLLTVNIWTLWLVCNHWDIPLGI